jgi:2'-5' RNA ligase
MRRMLVHGAIIPPRSVLDPLADALRSVAEPAEVVPAAQPRSRLGRLGRRRDEAPDAAVAPMLEPLAPARMQLPLAGFGNLTTSDAHRLADTLQEAARAWSAPRVWFAGGTALDFPGDWSVWAKLDGDVDALGALARGVTQSVEHLGYFVDRRQFRPMMSIATVTPATTGPFLEAVVGALDAFRGEEWTVEISLTKEAFAEGGSEMVEFERIRVAG